MSDCTAPTASPLRRCCRTAGDGTDLFVLVRPRAKETTVVGLFEEEATGRVYLEVQLSVPPADGIANQLLLRVLADTLGVPRTAITLKRGKGSKRKTVRIAGRDVDRVQEALSSFLRPRLTPAR